MNSWKQTTELAISPALGGSLWESRAATEIVSAQVRLAELARTRAGSQPKELPAERLKHALSVLSLAEQSLTQIELDTSETPTNETIRQLAFVEAYSSLFEARRVFENQPQSELFETLRGRSQAIVSRWQAAEVKRPMELLREAAPALQEILSRLQTLSSERLFIHPEQAAAVAKDTKEIAEKLVDLRRREGEVAETIRKAPGKEADFIERASTLVDERTSLEAEQARREASYQRSGIVGLLDPRRKQVFDPPIDLANIDVEVVRERRALLGGKLRSLDEELEKLRTRLPDLARDPEGSSISPDLWALNQVLKWNGSKDAVPVLDRLDLYEFLYGQGKLYTELTREMDAIQAWLQSLVEEYELQSKGLQEIRDFAKQGNVFLAEKRMSKLARKFKGLGYRRCDEAIQEGMRPIREAQRISAEIDEYLSKRKGLFGKMFKDGNTRSQLENRIVGVRGQVASLAKCELKTAVQDLCTKLEASLRAS